MKYSTKSGRDWPLLIESWKNSGLSRAAFCRQHHLPYNSFCSALKSNMPTVHGEEKRVAGFIKAIVENPPISESVSCVIESKDGLRITLTGIAPDFVRSLLN